MFRRILMGFMSLTLLLSAPAVLRAQDSAAMTGMVTDTTGAVVPGTTVTLKNSRTGVTFTQTTDAQGSYRFANVPAGPGYEAAFAHEGFASANFLNLYLNVGITRTQNAKLIAGTNEQVEVSASNQEVTLNTTDASIGNNFDVKLINDLPVQNRDTPAALFNLQPGIANGAVTGARQDQNEVTLDGMDTNDLAAGQSNGTFTITAGAPVDSVEQFRGVTAGLVPSIGTGSGGQFQLVTRSGTNQFHGNLNEYHRDTSTAANSWFNNNAGLPRTPLIRNQFGGAIGGPILRDKLFFFFDFNNSRIIQSSSVAQVVPLDSFRNGNVSYIKNTANGATCGAASRQNTTPQCIGMLTSTQVAGMDPQHIGFDPALLTFINQRYPHANDLTGGDGINTGFFRFTTPTPDLLYNYVARIDYNLTPSQKIFGRLTLEREDRIYTPVEFAGDPTTNPFVDRSYGYVVSHIWAISANKVNQFYYGDTITKYNFPTLYNPTGTSQFTFGSGPTVLAGPYASGSSQKRRIPIPEVRDDFNWQRGNHSIGLGGTFKFIKTNSNLVNDFNFVTVGLGGENLALDATLRPSDIRTAGTTAASTYDNAFALALGRVGAVSSNYNYNNKGVALTQGGGETRRYRFFQTELYAVDTWNVSKQLTLTYGLRYQLYSVPYEVNGNESVQNFTFDQYFAARLAQSAAGKSGNTAVPFITYNLGGKANNGPNLYAPSYKDLAPRFAFAYTPGSARKTVINGSAALVYDRTVINAVNFVQDQSSYLFQNNANTQYGNVSARQALLNDPRLGANLAIPAPPSAPAITKPYTPFVDENGPNGLAGNQFNDIVDPTLKDPYSITFNLGLQQELPAHFLFKLNYAGRLGRRLIAQADASQLIDFPDTTSGQSLATAFGNLTQELRAGSAVQAQPWFENQIGKGYTSILAKSTLGTLISNGDFADFTQALASFGLIDANVGMASQFAENTYITNKGSSNYNGMLLTLTKNLSQGLQFDFNYTWSHSIDNVSAVANFIAAGQGTGFVCDARNLRVCRGNSGFDITHVISSDFLYDLPFGRGRSLFANTPRLLDEVIGGWSLSGTPQWQSGTAFSTASSAYVAGYANNAPAIFVGQPGDLKAKVHKSSDGSVNLFADPTRANAAFVGPVGLQIGSRNNLRGPSAFNMNLGLAKNFPLIADRLNLRFRADAFNALNHPTFSLPTQTNSDITGGTFGRITSTSNTARVAQFALRLEF